MAKTSPESHDRPRLLALELWGIGDVALAVPFLRAAARHADVTLLAKAHAGPILRRFAPGVRHITFDAPWTAFSGKYRLHRWPWRAIASILSSLRHERPDIGVSPRADPRDHVLLRLAGASRTLGFGRAGSKLLLNTAMPQPQPPHRATHWARLTESLGWPIPSNPPTIRSGRRIIIHTGAGQPVRTWPADRFAEIARRLSMAGWDVRMIDDQQGDLDCLLDLLDTADRFIGNDSGPGHLAALLGVPTFTIFGPQLPELFSPQHPSAGWIEGAPCPHKPCWDRCRFSEPHCLQEINEEAVWKRLVDWLGREAPN